jgi:hypothetical protein
VETTSEKSPCASKPRKAPITSWPACSASKANFEGREFPKHPEVMAALACQIKAVAAGIDPTPAKSKPAVPERPIDQIKGDVDHFLKVAEAGGKCGALRGSPNSLLERYCNSETISWNSIPPPSAEHAAS